MAVEGPCPKLRLAELEGTLVLVHGTYGLENMVPTAEDPRIVPAQSLAVVKGDQLGVDAKWIEGLPRDSRGWVPLDLELGGRFPENAWLAGVEMSSGRIDKGALLERRRTYFAWEKNQWTESPKERDRVLPGILPPPFPEATICKKHGPEARFGRHSTERLFSGDTLIAGRCEDALHRAVSGVLVASFVAGRSEWTVHEAPPSPLEAGIVNVDIVYVARKEAYVYAWAPYDENVRTSYLVAFDGSAFTRVEVPFVGPIVSMSRASDGSLWAVAHFESVYRKPKDGPWVEVALPAPRFVEPLPPTLRVLEVQSADGATWVHAAYPVEVPRRDRVDASRNHVLLTTRPWKKPAYCSHAGPLKDGLREEGPKAKGAATVKKAEPPP